ncbi:CPBP family intramembrane metalloprotease [Staphylococcus gallinarum]|uniref:CPBP family intramembrane glutamic endopeptidase n=1 Tax=Staphylococcus gallinarum TaxID=1293 RepID=UPI00211CB41C|nr:type II CAAX endopeptidase family protein [Staphylococcus gallinarum]MCQ9288235.1 CPBP family intramembrane metalloprotease [Staphylococcus gallinarum]
MNHSNSVKPKGNRIINILIFIGLMFLVSSPTMIAGSIIYSVVNHASLWIVIGITVLGIIWTVFMMWLFRWYYRKKSYETHQHRFRLKDILINILWFIVLRITIGVFTLIMQSVFGDNISENDKILLNQMEQLNDLSVGSIIGLLFFLIVIIFVAPFLEELLFRGIFKETIFKKSAFLLPLIISSAIFSSLHGSTNWISFLMYMTLGMGFYMVYNRRKNLKDSMMVHMLNNAMAGIAMLVMVFT